MELRAAELLLPHTVSRAAAGDARLHMGRQSLVRRHFD